MNFQEIIQNILDDPSQIFELGQNMVLNSLGFALWALLIAVAVGVFLLIWAFIGYLLFKFELWLYKACFKDGELILKKIRSWPPVYWFITFFWWPWQVTNTVATRWRHNPKPEEGKGIRILPFRYPLDSWLTLQTTSKDRRVFSFEIAHPQDEGLRRKLAKHIIVGRNIAMVLGPLSFLLIFGGYLYSWKMFLVLPFRFTLEGLQKAWRYIEENDKKQIEALVG